LPGSTDLELEQPVPCRRITLYDEQIVVVPGVNTMDSHPIAQDPNGFGEPGHIHAAQRGAEHLVLNDVLFYALRVVLTVVAGPQAQDERRVARCGANRTGVRCDDGSEHDHFSNGGCQHNV